MQEIREMFSDAGNQRKVLLSAACEELVATQGHKDAPLLDR